jgi:DNA polymerase III subunit chi
VAAAPAVEFRTGIRDKLGYVTRWLAVAVRHGGRVRVLAEPPDLSKLSQMLWTGDRESFLPHVICHPDQPLAAAGSASQSLCSRTAIWLGGGATGAAEPELLLNMAARLPDEVTGYGRVIDLVGTSEAEVVAGRQRWAGYRQRGLVPVHRAPGAAADSAD